MLPERCYSEGPGTRLIWLTLYDVQRGALDGEIDGKGWVASGELTDLTGLGQWTVSKVTNPLADAGVIERRRPVFNRQRVEFRVPPDACESVSVFADAVAEAHGVADAEGEAEGEAEGA